MTMSPANKEEWATIRECTVRIKHLEESLKDLKHEMRNQVKDRVERKRYISHKRLSIYLAAAAILGAIACQILDFLIR